MYSRSTFSFFFFFFKQKTAYEMRISDWSSDVCSSDLQDRGDRRFADVATEPATVLVQHLLEAFELADTHQVIQLLARIRKVFAEMIVDRHALTLELGLQHLRYQWCATATGGSGLPAFLQRRQRRAAAGNRLAPRLLRHVVDPADLPRRRQRTPPPP